MGLLNPNRLLWAISIAILLAIYLRSRSRPTLEVSSLLLFDEAAAPTTRVRHLRIESVVLAGDGVARRDHPRVGGLYVRTRLRRRAGPDSRFGVRPCRGHGRARGKRHSAGRAKQQALAIVDAASERDRFSVIGYALDAEMIHPETANRDAIRHAIAGLRSMAVPGRRAAQSAALMRARASGEVEFFADRKPPASVIADPD